jgi:hypothetical protein
MRSIILAGALVLLLFLVASAQIETYSPYESDTGKYIMPSENLGGPWYHTGHGITLGDDQNATITYDGTYDNVTVAGADLTILKGLNVKGNIGVNGTLISNGKISDPTWIDNKVYVTDISYLNRTKTGQLEADGNAYLNRTRATRLDVAGRSDLNRTRITQLDVAGLSALNRTKTTQLESSTRADLNRTRATQLDVSGLSSLNRTAATQFAVSGLTGLNATIAARPISQPVSEILTGANVYSVTTDINLMLVDASGGNATITLPVATSNTGRSYTVLAVTDPGSYYVIITATSGSLIAVQGTNTGSTYLVSTDTAPFVTLTSDGTKYRARTTGTWSQHA